jgi:pimeloyl-ACP methyl ester carboxylesterase
VLRFREEGGGRPLIFVTGWSLDAQVWEGQFQRFAADYRVIAYDPRAQGRSWAPGLSQSTRRRARDLAELMRALHAENAVLVGWSLGALEVLDLLDDPAAPLPRGVVFVDQSLDRGCQAPGQGGGRLLKKVEGQPQDKVVGEFVSGLFARPRPEAELQALRRVSAQMPREAGLAALQGATTGPGLRAVLQKRTVPAVCMVSQRLYDEMDCLAHELPSLQVFRFDGCGHALFLEEPMRFNQALDAFLQGLP